MIKVFVADDHPVVREGLKQILTRIEDIVVVGEATTGQEVIDRVPQARPDILILDLNMPGRDGFDVLRVLRRSHPHLRILVLSVYPEGQVGLRVLALGANGFINKESIPQQLEAALRTLAAGRDYVPADVTTEMLERFRHEGSEALHTSLSVREFQVLLLLASGLSVKEIADRFALSVKTVRTFRTRVLKKLNLKNDVELTHYALKYRLITSPPAN